MGRCRRRNSQRETRGPGSFAAEHHAAGLDESGDGVLGCTGACVGWASTDSVRRWHLVQAGQLRYILVGVALMLLMIFRPQGVFGNKKELAFA